MRRRPPPTPVHDALRTAEPRPERQDAAPERRLPPPQTQHLSRPRGRLRDAREAGREQRLVSRVHGQQPEAGPGDDGARGAGRRAGAHHAGRVLHEDRDPGARGGAELFHEDGEAEADRCFWDDSQDLGTEKP